MDFVFTMNYRTGIKFLLTFTALIVLFFTSPSKIYASDYQYKILDPKYNPQAEKIVDGNIPPIEEVKLPDTKKSFDFATFFAIFALVVFPLFIISLAVKTFKEVFEDIPGRETQTLGNVKIAKKEETKTENSPAAPAIKPSHVSNKNYTLRQSTNKVTSPYKPAPSEKLPQTANTSINKYFSSKVNKIPNPMLLNTAPLASNKGLCLVEYNKKYSLIGYINDEIFLLNRFDNLNSHEIRSRLSESINSRDRYIVRLGNYKALVEVSDSKMNLLIEL